MLQHLSRMMSRLPAVSSHAFFLEIFRTVRRRLSTIRNADVIYVIEAGKVVEEGTHDALVKIEGGAYNNLVSRQMQAQKKLDGADEKGRKMV